MARYETSLLGDFESESQVTWTTKDSEFPFTIRDSTGTTITITPHEAKELTIFLTRWLFEYLD